MTVNAEYWQQQRFDRVVAGGRTPEIDFTVPELGGFAWVRGEILADEAALPLLDPSERARVVKKTDVGAQDWLQGTPLTLYRYTADPGSLLEFVAEWRRRDAATGRTPKVALHYVLTGEMTPMVPRGGPASNPWVSAALGAPVVTGVPTDSPVVAVLDTGIDVNSAVGRLRFDPAVSPDTWCVFDAGLDVDALVPQGSKGVALGTEAGHGTFIASIVSRQSGGVRVAVLKVLDADGFGCEQSVVEGLRRIRLGLPGGWADRVAVVNLSLGGFTDNGLWATTTPAGQAPKYTQQLIDGYAIYHSLSDQMPIGLAEELKLWKDTAVSSTVIVAAAGNDGQARKFWPAAAADPANNIEGPTIVAVGSLDGTLSPSDFTNTGSWVTVSTLGEEIVGDFPAGDYPLDEQQSESFAGGGARWSGSSFAAPIVAAAIARNVVSANLPGQAATGQTGWTAVQQQLAAAKAASVPGLGLVFDPRQHGLKLDPRIG